MLHRVLVNKEPMADHRLCLAGVIRTRAGQSYLGNLLDDTLCRGHVELVMAFHKRANLLVKIGDEICFLEEQIVAIRLPKMVLTEFLVSHTEDVLLFDCLD